jgi:conjugative relaxase-like TrwC/TraI family protein
MGASGSTGSDSDYYTKQVGQPAASYYLNATTRGEPAGRWSGAGAAALGLKGTVDADVMRAVYGRFLDPRDARFHDPETRALADRLGSAPGQYRTRDEILLGKVVAAAGVPAERVAELRAQVTPAAGQSVERAVADSIAGQSGILPEQVSEWERAASGQARSAVQFVDVTFSVPKSVTVLHTSYARAELDAARAGNLSAAQGWADKREAVETAIWAGNAAMLDHLNEQAGYARAGEHGAGADRWVDARGWTVASFFQHDSRDHDPQLHIHNPILNRALCADGKARALDSRAIHRSLRGAGSIGERVMEENLSRSLGVAWTMRADGTGREVAGVDQRVMDLFSKRSTRMSARLNERVEAFRAHFDREPTALELDRMTRQAVMYTRQGKGTEQQSRAEQLDRWDTQLRAEVAGGLTRVAETVGQARAAAPAAEWSPSGVIAEAVAACQTQRATWGRSELARQITLALPESLGLKSDGQVREVVETLTDRALAGAGPVVQVSGSMPSWSLPEGLRLSNGASAYVAPTATRYASAGQMVAEHALIRAAAVTDRHALTPPEVDRWLQNTQEGRTLGPDQAAAAKGLMTSGAALSVLVGPAGTGKSHTIGAVATGWPAMTGGTVYGLATSEAATKVLAEDGVTARNVSQWLGTQGRLAAGGQGSADRAWGLTSRDVVVVDEASMVTTAALEEIRAHVDAAGARMVLAGDPRQLAAVGAGGAMGMLADGRAVTHTLAEVRRFSNPWERAASLQLRDGSREAIAEYDRRGRLVDAGTVAGAVTSATRAYLGDTLAGRSSLVVTPTNEAAAAAASEIRDRLVDLGRVGQAETILGRDGNECGVGDLVQARRNEWGAGLVNRERYTVQEVRQDGSMVVRSERDGGMREVSAQYAAEDLSLGYAATAHSAQGLTTDTSHAVVSPASSPEGVYVAMSRGRDSNIGHVATQREVADEATGQTHGRDRLDPVAVLQGVLDRAEESERAALVVQAEDAERAASMATIQAQYEAASRAICRSRTDGWLDHLAADGVITPDERLAFATDQATDQLSRQLRAVEQAGHDPAQVLREAIEGRTLDGLRSVAQGVQGRISESHADAMGPQAGVLGEVPPADVPATWQEHLAELREAAADRSRVLGSEVAAEPPAWAVEALGPVPADPLARADWEHRAGIVAGYREATGHDAPDQAIGASPGTSQPELRGAWHEAWVALGRPQAGQEERELSEGALRCRVQARARELAWQPRNVDAEMKATGLSVARHEQEAATLRAEAAAAVDPAEAERLSREADDRAQLAATMREVEAGLAEVAEQRAAWLVETAVTREIAERAQAELANRGRDIGAEQDRITAEEWLAAEAEARQADDPHREVSEVDVLDPERDAAMAEITDPADDRVEQAEPVAEVEAADPVAEVAEENDMAPAEPVAEPDDDQAEADDVDDDQAAEESDPEPVAEGADEAAEQVAETPETLIDEEDDTVHAQPVAEVDDDQADEAVPNVTGKTDDTASDLQEEAEAVPNVTELPAGVPHPVEVEADVAVATVAADEIADRRSAEQAHAADEVAAREAAEQESRETAWHDADQAEQADAAAAETDDVMA